MRRGFGLLCLGLSVAFCSGTTAEAKPYSHAREMRREARQLTQFEAALAAQPSATRALEGWCGRLAGVDFAAVTARSLQGQDSPRPVRLSALLGVPAGEALAYRHVRLDCQLGTLSEAHNWYVPARLTRDMNAALASTDTPFGKVAVSLHFTREAISSQRGRGEACPARTILTNRALLRLPDGQPLALVIECYTVLNLRPFAPKPVRLSPTPPSDSFVPAPSNAGPSLLSP